MAQLGAIARRFSLDRRERAVLRRELEEMVERPVVRRSWRRAFLAVFADFTAAPFGRVTALRPVLAVTTIAVLLSAVGVSYAAEGALPGDALYSVKVRFNEEARAALIVDKLDRIEWEGERAVRRLDEAEVLVREGRLNETKRLEAVDDYIMHMEKAASRIEAAEKDDDTVAERAEERIRQKWEKGKPILREIRRKETRGRNRD